MRELDEKKCIESKLIQLEELKYLQLKILDALVSFCETEKINYWIDSGTLLGAIRHKGYIPWDDDIDVGMLRKDYDKFMREFNKSSERYKAYSIENNAQFLYAHGKVLDTTTLLYEPDEKGNKLSVNIDIFVYDNAPDNDRLVKKMYAKRDFYQIMRNLQMLNHIPKGNFFRKVSIQLLVKIAKIFPDNYFVKKKAKNSKKYAQKGTKRVGNFTACSKIACNKEIFKNFIKVEFEGKYYNAPVGYDEWLKAFYGDYMKLPPIEKQVSHHKFKAYIKE